MKKIEKLIPYGMCIFMFFGFFHLMEKGEVIRAVTYAVSFAIAALLYSLWYDED